MSGSRILILRAIVLTSNIRDTAEPWIFGLGAKMGLLHLGVDLLRRLSRKPGIARRLGSKIVRSGLRK